MWPLGIVQEYGPIKLSAYFLNSIYLTHLWRETSASGGLRSRGRASRALERI